jgi:hypothetical protein
MWQRRAEGADADEATRQMAPAQPLKGFMVGSSYQAIYREERESVLYVRVWCIIERNEQSILP